MNTAVLSDSRHDTERELGTENPERELGTDDPEYSGIRPLPRLEPGDCISNKYLIRGVLGTGGFAVVYEAEHLGLQCLMAIKVLHVNEHTPDTLIARFREEARISAVVHHLNVLDVHDTGTLEDGSPYLVMERIYGETLHACMGRGLLPVSDVVEVARQLLNALCMLNERGIVHRDIKPENLMLHTLGNGERIVKLVDFGISKMVRSELSLRSTIGGGVIGTPHYMSPEHLSGEEVTAQSDIYAAGVVLYEALAGKLPFDGASLNALVFSVLHCDCPALRSLRPDCPPELERIVCTAMSRDRKVRYATPEAMLADVEELARTMLRPGYPLAALVSSDAGRRTGMEDAGPAQGGSQASDASQDAPLSSIPGSAPEAWTSTGASIAPAPAKPSRARIAVQVMLLSAACILAVVLGPRAEPTETLPPASSSILTQASALPSFDPKVEHTIGAFGTEARAPSAERLADSDLEEPTRRSRGAHKPPAQKQHAETVAPAEGHDEPVRVTRVVALPVPRDAAASSLPIANEPAERAEHGGLLGAALASYVRGRHTEAHLLYRRATAVQPNAAQAWRGLGIVAARMGNNSEARTALERYLELSPTASDAQAIRNRLKALR